jgi:hypothetical protein
MEPEKRANLGVMKEEVVFNKFLAFFLKKKKKLFYSSKTNGLKMK